MKASFFCFFLTLIIIILLSTTAQAAEYREVDKEVNASDILTHIEMGEDVNLVNCSIVEELNVSKKKTVPNPLYYRLLQAGVSKDSIIKWGCSENLHIIESNLTIINTTFQKNVDLSNVFFQNPVDFERVTFNGSVNFSWTTFNDSVGFSRATFNDSANFMGSNFYDFANFSRATFKDSANFIFSNFYGFANFDFTNFKNNSNFSFAHFKNTSEFFSATFDNSSSFNMATFNDYAYFERATFQGSANFASSKIKNAYFYEAIFYNDVDFIMATFNFANFESATFYNVADFSWTFCSDNANFNYVTFNDSVNFMGARFENYSDFYSVIFNNAADFSVVTFNNTANFAGVTFKDSADLRVPSTSKNILVPDVKTCEIFRQSFNEKSLYKDADNMYYNLRKITMDEEDISFSKLIDFISWVTCGFGTRLEYTFSCIIAIIIFFAFLYKNPGISLLYWVIALQFADAKIQILKPDEYKSIYEKSKNTELSLKLYWGKPGIYISDRTENKKLPSNLDLLYYSINTFTRLGSSNWYSKDNFRKIETLESALGWIMLAIFLATLMHLLIRP